MILIVIESPFAGKSKLSLPQWRIFKPLHRLSAWLDERENIRYARECMADSLRRGEAPIASHLLYTQPGVLNDQIPEERMKGIHAGFAWGERSGKRVFYCDRGFSSGMRYGQEEAKRLDQTIEYRCIYRNVNLHE